MIAGRTRGSRVYVRRFDHDEARLRHAAGESIAALAREYGVTRNAVRTAVTPGAHERSVVASRRSRTGTCEDCGGPAMRNLSGKAAHNPDGRVVCLRCRADIRRERLLFDSSGALIAVRCSMLECANGERWQAPENFPNGARHREVRKGGIHSQCRACQTRARQDYRERHKVPCVQCGEPRLPQAEKNGGARTNRVRDTGLCVQCYRQSVRTAA